MSNVSLSGHTSMTGQTLRDAISREANSTFSQSPYSMFHPSGSWQGNQFVVTGDGISGGVTVTESGGGSDVSVNLNLSGGAVIGASAIRTRFQEIFARLGGSTGTSAPSTSAPSTAPTTGQPTTQEPARPRLQVDWGIATSVIGTIGTSIVSVFDNMARGTAQEVAQQYGVDQSTVNQSMVTNPSVTKGQSVVTKVIPGYQPMAPQQEDQGVPAPVENGDTGFVMPTWGWAAVGIGGAAMVGFVIYLAMRK